VATIFTTALGGVAVDWLRSPGRLSTTVVRKSACALSFASTGALLVGVGYVGCDRTLAVAILLAALACAGVAVASIAVNQLDLAPLHAGKVMGLTLGFSTLAAILAPLAVGALTYERSTRDEWRKVFFLAAAIYAVGAAVFVVFGSGDRQSWAE